MSRTAAYPLAAEYAAALFVAMCEMSEDYEDALVDGFVPEFDAAGGHRLADHAAGARLGVCDGRAAKAAAAAASRMVDAGVEPPSWAAELSSPVTAGGCWRLADPDGTGSMLICSFDRAAVRAMASVGWCQSCVSVSVGSSTGIHRVVASCSKG